MPRNGDTSHPGCTNDRNRKRKPIAAASIKQTLSRAFLHGLGH
jgi:hypothetical protein